MKKKCVKITVISVLSLIAAALILYLAVIPAVFSNEKALNSILNFAGKSLNCKIQVKNPVLKTSLLPVIAVKTGEVTISGSGNLLLEIKNLDSEFSFSLKKITVNKLLLDYIFADAGGLMELFPQDDTAEKKPENKSNFGIDLYDSILAVNQSKILYKIDKNTILDLTASASIDNTRKDVRPVKFDLDTKIIKPDKTLHFAVSDNGKVVIKDKLLIVDDCTLDINKSCIHIDILASKKDGINADVYSKGFDIEDVYDIIGSNLLISSGSEMLAFFRDMTGSFDFDIKMNNDKLDGKVNLNSFSTKIVPVNNMPVTITKGTVYLTSDDIVLKDIEGYYGKNRSNIITAEGQISDYNDTCQTDIKILTTANNEFLHDYISPIAGIPLTLTGDAGSIVNVTTIYDKIDVVIASKLPAGSDILIDGASLTPVTYDRAVSAKMHFENNILDIKSIDYYIAQSITHGVDIKPILSLNGRIDCSTEIPDIVAFGFNIPDPLPGEFLNLFAGEKMFKGGKFSGDVYYVHVGEYPKVWGKLHANDIRVPDQKIYLKKGEFYTDKETLHVIADGKFKRSNFKFTGDVFNGIKFPIIIKNVEFALDKIDVEKLLLSMNGQTENSFAEEENTSAPESSAADEEDEGAVDFDISNLIIEKCIFKLDEGKYKDIDFGNINANLTLDKDSVLKIESNKFNIADGISTLKVVCNLKNQKYALRLGVKDVDSEKMSASILNITKEISGKASGLIEINTDSSMKLNGLIKFAVNDGTIPKIGLVEYLFKFASLFRNPLIMISPAILGDIINIPEGNFDKISGELYIKENVIELMKIKSSSPSLAAYIVGNYNLGNGDAILRIYTKFSNKNKGFSGFLRGFSLNSLANRIPQSSRSDANYYAAELEQLPEIDDEKNCQIFLTKVDGDVEHNNFLSSLKKIK